jgi:hypothetical protein
LTDQKLTRNIPMQDMWNQPFLKVEADALLAAGYKDLGWRELSTEAFGLPNPKRHIILIATAEWHCRSMPVQHGMAPFRNCCFATELRQTRRSSLCSFCRVWRLVEDVMTCATSVEKRTTGAGRIRHTLGTWEKSMDYLIPLFCPRPLPLAFVAQLS